MDSQPYTNREMDMKFKEITDLLADQNITLEAIDKKVGVTNGKVADQEKRIAETKSDVASNWRAMQVGTAMFVLVVVPLCAIIYNNIQNSIKAIQTEITKEK